MITIVNLRRTRNCIRVDQATVLGNPFVISTTQDRDRVCDLYEEHLNQQFRIAGSPVNKAINELVTRYDNEGTLTLGCWCAPERCHAESIRSLIYALSRGAAQDEQAYLEIERGE